VSRVTGQVVATARRRALRVGTVVALLAVLPALAAPPVQRTRVVTTTRLVTLFHGLEYDLVDALRAPPGERLNQLLAGDFEQRDANAPAVPTPREAWLAATSLRAPGAVRITDMAVHDRGELAIVSFSLQLEGPGQTMFVVDVWRQRAPSAYELVTRYASAVAPPPLAAPATSPATGKPPDGKG
jgi:hypothetical protein